MKRIERGGRMALPISESYCVGCGRVYEIERFFKSPNPMHCNGVVPYCKECNKRIVKQYLKEYKSIESAMWLACAEIGIPFIRKVFAVMEEALDKAKNRSTFNYMGNYLAVMHRLHKKSDCWRSFADTDVAFGDIKNLQKHEEDIKESMEKFRLDWGYHEVEEYQFLEYRYEFYTEGLGVLTPSQETLYRRLCLVELAIRKKDEEGLDTKDEQKQIIQLMKTLEIDDFKNTKEKGDAERIIEAQIAWMEEEEPAYHYRDVEKYKDFCGIGKYWDDHIKRPLKNLLTGSKEYTLSDTYDEMAEYRE